jgi:hypothetical protein
MAIEPTKTVDSVTPDKPELAKTQMHRAPTMAGTTPKSTMAASPSTANVHQATSQTANGVHYKTTLQTPKGQIILSETLETNPAGPNNTHTHNNDPLAGYQARRGPLNGMKAMPMAASGPKPSGPQKTAEASPVTASGLGSARPMGSTIELQRKVDPKMLAKHLPTPFSSAPRMG